MSHETTLLPQLGRTALVHEAHVGLLIDAFKLSRQIMADTTMRGQREAGVYSGYRIDQGAAIIPMRGALITDGPMLPSPWGFATYEGLRAEIKRAAADPKVSTIVLAVNTPGGMVAGLDTAIDAIRAARQKKPVIAMVEGICASAGYWLAAQADEIVMSPMSEAGSIGIVAMHVDVSGAMEKAGYSIELIAAGAHKIEGSPYAALSDDARAEIKAEVEAKRQTFAADVGQGRGARFTAAAALATEAKMYDAKTAVTMGLADRIGSLDSIIASSARNGRASVRKGLNMDVNNGATGADTPIYTQAAFDSAVKTARAEGVKLGAEDERKRVGAIIGDDRAKGREALANHFAFSSDLPAEAVLAALDKTPAVAAAQPSRLDAAMAASQQPHVSPAGASAAQAARPGIDTAAIYASRAAAGK